ncbi:MAG: sigma factor-like helix-turn-helix DNA-binding protein [Nannocystaceae bacterium]
MRTGASNATSVRAHERLEHAMRLVSGGGADPGQRPPAPRTIAALGALEELPERWREAFVLREVQGLSIAEAAATLGITAENLAVRPTARTASAENSAPG